MFSWDYAWVDAVEWSIDVVIAEVSLTFRNFDELQISEFEQKIALNPSSQITSWKAVKIISGSVL